MNIKSFAEHFHTLADAPNGIQKMREMILQLAVQGKLTRQNPNDERASVLLKKIKAEKEKLIKEGNISKQKPLPPISPNDMPHELSMGWEWVRLGKISAKIHYGYTASAIPIERDVRFLRITDIQDDHVKWDEVPGCQIDEAKFKGYELSGGDILIARTGGTIGKSYLVRDLSVRAVFASYLIRVILTSNTFSQYIKLFLGSELYWTQLYNKSMGTGQPNVNATALKSLCVPLPPLAEQKRIVAKVDQLMAMFGELEAGQKKRAEKRITLNNTCLNALTYAREDLTQNAWKRISDNFNLLYDCPENVSELRQAILQLAVRGKLVCQNPEDKPASELLKEINAEKEKLIKEGRLKKQKPLPPINPDDMPYELPKGWEWIQLHDVSMKITDGEHLSPKKTDSGVLLLTAKHVTENGVVLDDPQFVSPDDAKQFRKRCNPERGDFLICSRGTIGRCTVIDIDEYFCLMGSVILIKPSQNVVSRYLMFNLRTNWTQEWMLSSSGATAVKALYLKDIKNCPISLPPLAEQKRIVAKVDQLMALCDELEAKLEQSQSTAETLMGAVVNELTTA